MNVAGGGNVDKGGGQAYRAKQTGSQNQAASVTTETGTSLLKEDFQAYNLQGPPEKPACTTVTCQTMHTTEGPESGERSQSSGSG